METVICCLQDKYMCCNNWMEMGKMALCNAHLVL